MHLGIITLFVGVAASSSFKTVHDVALNPGEKTRAWRATSSPTSSRRRSCTRRPTAGSSGSRFGAELRVRKGGSVRTLHTSKDYFPSQDPTLGPVSRFFDGETTTEVALDAGLGKDIWAAVAPDIVKLRDRIAEGDRLFDRAADDLSAEQSSEFLALALRGLTDRYTQSPPPARFRLEVNPMVTWIWIGALLAVLGGFIAGWPPRRGISRAASARYAARRSGATCASPRPKGPGLMEVALIALVVASAVYLVTDPLRSRAKARGREPRGRGGRARGGQGGQVPRDPRRRARLQDRQALRGRLALAGPQDARRGR